jgi:hypothetical protein
MACNGRLIIVLLLCYSHRIHQNYTQRKPIPCQKRIQVTNRQQIINAKDKYWADCFFVLNKLVLCRFHYLIWWPEYLKYNWNLRLADKIWREKDDSYIILGLSMFTLSHQTKDKICKAKISRHYLYSIDMLRTWRVIFKCRRMPSHFIFRI